MFQDVLKKLWNNEDLTAEKTYSVIDDISRDTLSEVQIDGFQSALLMKGPAQAGTSNRCLAGLSGTAMCLGLAT